MRHAAACPYKIASILDFSKNCETIVSRETVKFAILKERKL
jgi:hypothetical protein